LFRQTTRLKLRFVMPTVPKNAVGPGQPSAESLQLARQASATDPAGIPGRSLPRLSQGIRRSIGYKGALTKAFYQRKLQDVLDKFSEYIREAALELDSDNKNLGANVQKLERDVLALKSIQVKTRKPNAWNGFLSQKAAEMRNG